MKKTLTLLTTLIAINAFGQVANGGFENWTTEVLFEDPDNWETGNWQDGDGLITTSKLTTMAPSGNYAVRMETTALPDDTAFGFVYQGLIDDDPVGGIPWSTEIQKIECYVRYDVMPNDTALILFTAWQGGNIISEALIPFTGTQTNWTMFSYTLLSGAVTPDSVFIAAASSNAINEIGITPGSWFEIDALQLTSTNVPNPDMIPNYDFEGWMDVSVEDPDDWSTLNGYVAALGFTSVDKSTDANSGSFSALIKTETFDGDTLPGFLTNGVIGFDGPLGGVPYVAIPENFSGAYKYVPSGQDTGSIACLFYSGGNIIGVASQDLTMATPNWTMFNSPVFIFQAPDTMAIVAYSGENEGSMLYIDDLDLTGGTVGLEELSKTDMKVFPNPANDQLTLLTASDLGHSQLSIYDLSGRTLLQQTAVLNTRSGHVIDISDLPSGTYILEINKDGERYRERIVKE